MARGAAVGAGARPGAGAVVVLDVEVLVWGSGSAGLGARELGRYELGRIVSPPPPLKPSGRDISAVLCRTCIVPHTQIYGVSVLEFAQTKMKSQGLTGNYW